METQRPNTSDSENSEMGRITPHAKFNFVLIILTIFSLVISGLCGYIFFHKDDHAQDYQGALSKYMDSVSFAHLSILKIEMIKIDSAISKSEKKTEVKKAEYNAIKRPQQVIWNEHKLDSFWNHYRTDTN